MIPVDRDVKMMIPVDIDVPQILADLRQWGWFDLKLEIACGFSNGTIRKLRAQVQPRMMYPNAARLYNLWCSEQERELARGLTDQTTAA